MVQHFMEKDYNISEPSLIGLNNIFLCLLILIIMPTSLDFSSLAMPGWLGLIFLGIFQIGFSYLFFFMGIQLISALKASMISLLEPLLNPILVLIFVGEIPSNFALIGFAFILFGIGLTMVLIKSGGPVEEYTIK